MAVTPTPVFTQTPKTDAVTIVNADASSAKTVKTGGVNGSKVVSLSAIADTTAAFAAQVGISISGTFYPIGATTIPASAGNDGSTPGVDLMNNTIMPWLPLDNDGEKYIFLKSTADLLQVKSLTTVTAGKTITVMAMSADF